MKFSGSICGEMINFREQSRLYSGNILLLGISKLHYPH